MCCGNRMAIWKAEEEWPAKAGLNLTAGSAGYLNINGFGREFQAKQGDQSIADIPAGHASADLGDAEPLTDVRL